MIRLCVLLLLYHLCVGTDLMGQARTKKFEIRSVNVKDQCYIIEVILPNSYDANKKYPVMYCLDWWLLSRSIDSVTKILEYEQAIEDFILVGISSAGDFIAWKEQRNRDFTPRIANNLNKATEGGASDFVRFLKSELIPTIEGEFSVNSHDRGFFGFSYGGLFGVNLLIEDRQLFQRWFIGSPSLWYGNFALRKGLEDCLEKGFNSSNRMYISVGELEPEVQITGFVFFREYMNKISENSDLVRADIIQGEGHMSSVPSALVRGFRFLFTK